MTASAAKGKRWLRVGAICEVRGSIGADGMPTLHEVARIDGLIVHLRTPGRVGLLARSVHELHRTPRCRRLELRRIVLPPMSLDVRAAVKGIARVFGEPAK